MSLGGFLALRDTTVLDYCWVEAVKSLLPICDEIVIADAQSTDGTREAIFDWMKREPKIKFVDYPWTDPRADIWWWPNFLNRAREHLSTDWAVGLDADEILHENSYDLVKEAARNRVTLRCKRLNFWRDAQNLIPHGKCCGYEVIRVGSATEWMPSDYPDPRAHVMSKAAVRSNAEIYHYGFLRKREAFFKKAHEVLRIWNNTYDDRLVRAEEETKNGGNWMEVKDVCGWENDLLPFTGTHPKIIHDWLRERGHSV